MAPSLSPLLAVLLLAPCHAELNAAMVTFRTVAFPTLGESVSLVVQSAHDSPITRSMVQEPPYPVYTCQVSLNDTLSARYEYVITRADNTTLHETELFGITGAARKIGVTGAEMSTPNEFFGEESTFYNLSALPASIAYSHQEITPHTIYNQSMVSTVSITADPKEWEAFIRASSKAKGYFGPDHKKPKINGSYSFMNPTHSFHANNVEIVLAGFGSLQQNKKSYNIHFDHDDKKAWGLSKHKIKAYTFDPSLNRETSTVDVFQAMALPVHRVSWTRLYLNGKNMGFYNNLEYISNKYIHERFPDSEGKADGAIYKCDDKAYMTHESAEKCNPVQGTAPGWTDLHALIDVFVNTTDAEFPAKIEAVFDVDLFLKHSAVELTMLRRDGYYDDGSNYQLWKNPSTNKWTYISWDFEIDMFDMDVRVFDKQWSFFKQPFMNTTVLPPYMPEIPMTRILNVPQWRSKYLELVQTTVNIMKSSHMQDRLDKLHQLGRPFVERDPLYSADMAYTVQDFDFAFASQVKKSKADIAFKRIFGWDPKIPDIFHSSILDVELIGLKRFMQQRAEIVQKQLSIAK